MGGLLFAGADHRDTPEAYPIRYGLCIKIDSVQLSPP